MTKIVNILYPRRDCRDDEIERLDGVLLQPGEISLHRCRYRLIGPIEPPAYVRAEGSQECSQVTYRWLFEPTVR